MHSKKRLLTTGLRLSTVGSRFLLIFFLARYLPIEEVGVFGLLQATIAYAVYPLGFDFYTYSTRQFVRNPKSKWRTYLKSQLAFAAVMFAVVIPFLALVPVLGLLPWTTALWLVLLVPLDYLCIELDRLLVAVNDQQGASVVLFLGSALAPLATVPALALLPASRNLGTILAAWVVCDVIALGAGAFRLLAHTKDLGHGRIDWNWIRIGARTALPFLAGTLCLRALFTLDRQVVRAFSDLATVGVYTFYLTLANGLTTVLYAVVQQFIYPSLVRAAHQRKKEAFRSASKALLRQSLIAIVLVVATAMLIEPWVLRFVGVAEYRHYAWLLPASFGVVAIYNLSLVPHYIMFALDADRMIMKITAFALASAALVCAIVAPRHAVLGALTGLLTASVVLLAGKAFFARRAYRLMDWERAPDPGF